MNTEVTKKTSVYVAELAQKHNVTYQNNGIDQFAKKLSELSDKSVEPDDTCDLIVALKRANVIDAREMSHLVVKHLREIKILKGEHA